MSDPALVEAVRTAIDAPQGLECTGYFTLNNRTKHLRQGLYVTVREEEASEELRPALWWEHFPVIELVQDGWRRRVHLGVGNPGKAIIFECHGPEAREGARIIREAMPELGLLLRESFFRRARAMLGAELEYKQLVPLTGSFHVNRLGKPVPEPPPWARVSPAYRPGRFRCYGGWTGS